MKIRSKVLALIGGLYIAHGAELGALGQGFNRRRAPPHLRSDLVIDLDGSSAADVLLTRDA